MPHKIINRKYITDSEVSKLIADCFINERSLSLPFMILIVLIVSLKARRNINR
jgi:ABC-type methionine transport system permease subunit